MGVFFKGIGGNVILHEVGFRTETLKDSFTSVFFGFDFFVICGQVGLWPGVINKRLKCAISDMS